MRAFKNKWFNRWARVEGISDDVLLDAANEIMEGKVEADLGGYLFKKRIARTGGGKRGGYRTIVGYKGVRTGRIIFLYGFAKNQRANISTKEEAALSLAAKAFFSANDRQLEKLVAEGTFWEVQHHE